MVVRVLKDINALAKKVEEPKKDLKVVKVNPPDPQVEAVRGYFHSQVVSGDYLYAVGMTGGCGAVQLSGVDDLCTKEDLVLLDNLVKYYEEKSSENGSEGVSCFICRLGASLQKDGSVKSKYLNSEELLLKYGFKEVACYRNEAHPDKNYSRDYQKLYVYTWVHSRRITNPEVHQFD